MSLIAHDFRTPIKDILHTAALWQSGTQDQSLMLASIGQVELNSRSTPDNFDGILRWIKSQFSHFEYNLVPCNIRELLIGVVNDLQQETRSKSHTDIIDIPSTITVTADAEILQFVHPSILRQIITLTKDGGTITIKAQQHGGKTTVVIEGHPVDVTPSLLRLLDLPQQEDKL